MPECGTWKSLWRSKPMEPSFSFKQTLSFDRENNLRIEAQRPPEKTTGLHNCRDVCAERNKTGLNTFDEADFVRDVENRGGC